MGDRMYQITAMGVMDQVMVMVKVYSGGTRHWELLMQTSVMVAHELGDSGTDDVLSIGDALRSWAQRAAF